MLRRIASPNIPYKIILQSPITQIHLFYFVQVLLPHKSHRAGCAQNEELHFHLFPPNRKIHTIQQILDLPTDLSKSH